MDCVNKHGTMNSFLHLTESCFVKGEDQLQFGLKGLQGLKGSCAVCFLRCRCKTFQDLPEMPGSSNRVSPILPPPLEQCGKAQAGLGKVVWRHQLHPFASCTTRSEVHLKYQGLNKFKQTNLPCSLSASGQQRAAHKTGLLFEETAE